MKLVIFGSTAGTGRELLEQALEQGHEVSAFARTPEKIDDLEYPNLQVIQGDVLDSDAVAATVAGQEAVLCTIGAGAGRTSLREDATRNIVRAMDTAGVQRLICLRIVSLESVTAMPTSAPSPSTWSSASFCATPLPTTSARKPSSNSPR